LPSDHPLRHGSKTDTGTVSFAVVGASCDLVVRSNPTLPKERLSDLSMQKASAQSLTGDGTSIPLQAVSA
jgi:hypothetical protein